MEREKAQAHLQRRKQALSTQESGFMEREKAMAHSHPKIINISMTDSGRTIV